MLLHTDQKQTFSHLQKQCFFYTRMYRLSIKVRWCPSIDLQLPEHPP